jgi:TRAP-type mannitol/chloroaromatic compound transport system permease small subunit
MRLLLSIARGIDWLTEHIGRLAVLIVPLLIVIGFTNVVTRFVGRAIGQRLSSNAVIEWQWYLFSILFLLSFAYILKHNVNVRVDFLYANWTPKQRATVDLLGTLLFIIPFCIMGMYYSWGPILTSWGRQFDGSWGTWEISPDPEGLPRAPIKSMILVGLGLLLLQSLSQTIKYIAVLNGTISGPEAEQIEEYHAARVE